MAIQTADGITSPGGGDAFEYETQLATLAQTTQLALEKRANSYIGTSGEREALDDVLPEGTHWTDTNGDKALYILQSGDWVRVWPIEVTPRTTTGFLTAQTGWKTTTGKSNYIQRRGDLTYINWFFERSGGTISVNAAGDIANQTVAILKPAWAPKTWQPLQPGEVGRVASYTVGDMDGACHIRMNAVGGTANITKGSVFQIRGWYNASL